MKPRRRKHRIVDMLLVAAAAGVTLAAGVDSSTRLTLVPAALADDGPGGDGPGGDGPGGDGPGGDGPGGDGPGGDGPDGGGDGPDGADGSGPDGDGDGQAGDDGAADAATATDGDDGNEGDDGDDGNDGDDGDDGNDGATGGGGGEPSANAGGDPGPNWRRPQELIAVNATTEQLSHATALGLSIVETVRAGDLELTISRLSVPRGVDAFEALALLRVADPGIFDLNHLYRTQARDGCTDPICLHAVPIGWPRDTKKCGRGETIGLIDTAINGDHPALRSAKIDVRRFAPEGRAASSTDHGTAISVLLVGASASRFPGLMPQARLYAADPFSRVKGDRDEADAVSFVRALEWLAEREVRLIGMAVAGFGNIALEAAVNTLAARGVIMVAAAGNEGPGARPRYPAAYDGVIAVTAVSRDRKIYRRANQGDYIDVAAPGVNVLTTDSRARDQRRSGTSFAVPFALAILAEAIEDAPNNGVDGLIPGLRTIDLGAPGRDRIFGQGLLVHEGDCE